MQDEKKRAIAPARFPKASGVMRLLVALAAAAAVAGPLAANAQSPRPSPAITGTQAGIQKAKQKQLQAQKTTKTDTSQRVNSGGAHADSESPDNPGSNQHKPMSGPGYAGGAPSASAPPK